MINDVAGLIKEVTSKIAEQTDYAVVGLSGGADSTLVAILCERALGKENVYGIHMPYNNLDRDTFNTKSAALAVQLGIVDYEICIGPAVKALTMHCDGGGNFSKLSELNQGNMRSRMRMVALYTTCCQVAERTGKQVRVIGTGNLSEDFIGYDTKGGDALADFFPIGELVKSEVYQLLDYFVSEGIIKEEMVNRTPSAGLWDGQTDEDELGHTYAEMEPYVLDMSASGQVDMNDPISKFVWNRHITNKHKHEAPPVIELRRFCDG